MDSESAELKAHQELIEQHRALNELLGHVNEALAERSGTIAEVSGLLARLGDMLVKHFESEEQGGYFAEALTHAPRLIARANALMAQHPKMTRYARELAGAADPDREPDLWWQQTRERFEAFRDELKQHESRENELLQEAYHRDLGSND